MTREEFLAALKSRNISQTQFAEYCGVTTKTIQNWTGSFSHQAPMFLVAYIANQGGGIDSLVEDARKWRDFMSSARDSLR